MIRLQITTRVKKFVKSLPPKHRRQIKKNILRLRAMPIPHDCKRLIGYKSYLRIDVGEYRVIYKYIIEEQIVTVLVVGRRNDGAVYKRFQRIAK